MTKLEALIKQDKKIVCLPKESTGNKETADILLKKLEKYRFSEEAVKSIKNISDHDLLLWIVECVPDESITICSYREYNNIVLEYVKDNSELMTEYLYFIGNPKAKAYAIARNIINKEDVIIDFCCSDILITEKILILSIKSPDSIGKYIRGEGIEESLLHGSLPRKYRRRLLKALNQCSCIYEETLKDIRGWSVFFSQMHIGEYTRYKNVYVAAFKLRNKCDNFLEVSLEM